MPAYVFTLTKELQEIIYHTRGKKDCRVAYTDEICAPSLFLVKDEGAYLMTASRTQLGNPKSVVAYAEGCKPEDGHIGGDDFAENLPLEWFTNAMSEKRTTFIVTMTEKEVRFDSK